MFKGGRERAFQYVVVSGDLGNGIWGYYTSGLVSRSKAPWLKVPLPER